MEKAIWDQAPDQYKVRESANAGIPPRKGMSQGQVLSMYGPPNTKSLSGDGETWTYMFKSHRKATFGQVITGMNQLALTPTQGIIMFGTNGRVKNFMWQ